MKPELQDKLIEIIGSIQAALSKASDFALEQLPDIAQQYVMFGRAQTAFVTIFLLLVAGAFFKYAYWAYKNPWNTSPYTWEKHKKRSDSNVLAIWLGNIFGAFFVIIAAMNIDLMVWFAPKVWLLKELAGLVK